jgi:putative SOS response-associated peptidase YedK
MVESYTMPIMNADVHPLTRRIHKPDPKLAADMQDKRSIVAIETNQHEIWLNGSLEQALSLVQLPPAEKFNAAATAAMRDQTKGLKTGIEP